MHESFARVRRPRKVPWPACWQPKVLALGRIFLARRGLWISSEIRTPPTQENTMPREGDGRFDAGEDIGTRWVCPYVESCLQKSVGGNGPEKRSSQRF